MNTTFYIFRHGLATHSTTGYGKDIFTAGILEEGKPAIRNIGEFLKKQNIEYWVCSDFLRCKQTAEIISGITGQQFIKDPRLNEFDNTNPLITETFDEVKKRISSFLEDMKKKEYTTIAICTHGAVIAGLKNLLISKKFDLENITDYPKPGILWVIKTGTLKAIDFN